MCMSDILFRFQQIRTNCGCVFMTRDNAIISQKADISSNQAITVNRFFEVHIVVSVRYDDGSDSTLSDVHP